MEIVIAVIAFVAGLGIAFVVAFKLASKKVPAQDSGVAEAMIRLQVDKEHVEKECASLREAMQRAEQENARLQNDCAGTRAELRASQESLRVHREHAEKESAARAERETQERAEREALHRQQLEELKGQFAEQLKAAESQFELVSKRLVEEQSGKMKAESAEQIGKVTENLCKELFSMRELVGKSKESNDKNIAELNGVLKTVLEQSSQIGKDAKNLADALKSRGKVQGDWGEQVLSDILSESGLIRDKEFFTQKTYTGERGELLRPDVVVECFGDTRIIVDSKVSLTAYTEYINAVEEADRERFSKENLDSVRKHVDELAEKNYSKVVKGAIPYVLMFVPNEGSYILAMNRDPAIGQYAYKKGVIIINPTNLMLALSLILQTWKNVRQEENCAKIVTAAEALYEKFCGFTDTFVKVGAQLQTAQRSYDAAVGQLKDGRGSVSSRFEGLRQLGLSTTKVINEKVSTQVCFTSEDS